MGKAEKKKTFKTAIVLAPYVLLVLFGLFYLGTHLFDKAHEDKIETLLVNRGNRFDR
jgi:hypothetical protein